MCFYNLTKLPLKALSGELIKSISAALLLKRARIQNPPKADALDAKKTCCCLDPEVEGHL